MLSGKQICLKSRKSFKDFPDLYEFLTHFLGVSEYPLSTKLTLHSVTSILDFKALLKSLRLIHVQFPEYFLTKKMDIESLDKKTPQTPTFSDNITPNECIDFLLGYSHLHSS
ncbi:hypothetical protein DIT68_10400 [Brumimicrobium oceani]|uniref:Uncharacterized protein n=1 Tax=Brumimicrobium oceani TaxID=2100725 RepID=A0A2U2XC33_9FLAO|nr:hypothetical protein DIT68_10400 [Brumimicrobium oceani]